MQINQPRKDGRTPLRIVAMMIKQRTTNPKNNSFKYYGARGVSFWPEWSDDYSKFEKYCLENGWKDGLQVDRIDNDGNYEPGNIQFITPKANIRKRPATLLNSKAVQRIFDLRNTGKTHLEIADVLGISGATVSRALAKIIWGDVQTSEVSKSVNTMAQKLTADDVWKIHKLHNIDGVPKKRLARQYGLVPNNMRRLLRGCYWNAIWKEFHYQTMFLKKRIARGFSLQLT